MDPNSIFDELEKLNGNTGEPRLRSAVHRAGARHHHSFMKETGVCEDVVQCMAMQLKGTRCPLANHQDSHKALQKCLADPIKIASLLMSPERPGRTADCESGSPPFILCRGDDSWKGGNGKQRVEDGWRCWCLLII